MLADRHHKFTFHNTSLLCRSDDIRTFGVESAWYSVVQYSLLGTCTTSSVLYKTTTKRVLTDDVQPSSSADAGRVVGPVDADHTLKSLSVTLSLTLSVMMSVTLSVALSVTLSVTLTTHSSRCP